MCSGAAVNARLKRIVFGAEDKKMRRLRFDPRSTSPPTGTTTQSGSRLRVPAKNAWPCCRRFSKKPACAEKSPGRPD
jgi:tRNA(Arg) A34 adenosine deaminase TadA